MSAKTIGSFLFLGFFGGLILLGAAEADEAKPNAVMETVARKGNSCPGLAPAEPFAPPNPEYRRKYDTLVHRFLDDEKELGQVTPAMFAILDDLIDEAAATLQKYPGGLAPAQEAEFAANTLNRIDCILLRHGFVYPGHGAVPLLSDALSPTMYKAANALIELKNHEHNIRRASFINARGAGPFHVVDCDLASYLYIAIAEVMGYPLHLVDMPDHNFVRWHFAGGRYLDYETMDGFVSDDNYYRTLWKIPDEFVGKGGILLSMNQTETLAYHDASVAVAWSWRHNFERMIEYYQRSISRDPSRALSFNNLAWYYANAPEPKQRNGAMALEYAQKSVSLLPSGDGMDTLACAYAQAGNFNSALMAEKQAVAVHYSPDESEIDEHIQLFNRKLSCNDTEFKDTNPFRP